MAGIYEGFGRLPWLRLGGRHKLFDRRRRTARFLELEQFAHPWSWTSISRNSSVGKGENSASIFCDSMESPQMNGPAACRDIIPFPVRRLYIGRNSTNYGGGRSCLIES